jgi:Zn-dependent protease with chaperone function
MSVRNIAILAQTALLGAALVPVKYYRPGHYLDRTPRELKDTERRIVKRGYDIDSLRYPRAEDKELLERFRAIARDAGQPDAPLLIAIGNKAYAGVADQYVVLSEPVEKNFTGAEQSGVIGHELFHRKVEREQGKQYEDFMPEELKPIEKGGDKYSYYLIRDARAIESGLRKMQAYNEQATYDDQPLIFRVLFSASMKQSIDQGIESGGKKHPATDARVSSVAQIDENETQARRQAEAKTRRILEKTGKHTRPTETRRMARNDTSGGDRQR